MRRLFVSGKTVFFIPLIGLMMMSCNVEVEDTSNNVAHYHSGAESFVDKNGFPVFNDGYGDFLGAGYQSTDFVFAGKYSLKLDSVEAYGMPITFTDVEVGEFFEASVWIKDSCEEATLFAGACGNTKYDISTTLVNKINDSIGWSQYFLNFAVETEIDTLKFYLFSKGKVAYFDNFEINRYHQRPSISVDSVDVMNIYIPDSCMTLLTEFKTKALQQTIISSDLKEYVGGFIVEKNDSIPIEIRLKGDWTDHLENGKTSYRIKTDKAYRGLTTFSIQHPSTRNYLHEWFMHELCDVEGLLSTSYDFLLVEINGVSQGIYAIEEHFDKQLLEHRNYREGPIIKIDETGFWSLSVSGKKEQLEGSYPYFESAMITCFKEGRTEKSPVLSNQFVNASSLLNLFKNLYSKPELLFDLEKMAKYYALMDIGNIHHAMAWHNRRYYYNPVTTKLEVIGFDMIPGEAEMKPLLAKVKFKFADIAGEDEAAMDYYLFSNQKFREFYTHYCTKFSSVDYLDNVFDSLELEISQRESILAYELPNYKMDKEFYYNRAEYVRNELIDLDSCWNQFQQKTKLNPHPKIITPNYVELTNPFFLKDISLNIYRSQLDSNHFKFQFENYHLADVNIIGYSTKTGEDSIYLLEKNISLLRYDGIKQAAYGEIVLPKKATKMHFTVANIPGLFQSKKVFDWQKPNATHPRITLTEKFSKSNKLFELNADTLIIKKGKHTVTELILVPNDYHILIEAGANIDIVNQGGLIFNNSVSINGTAQEKIIFTSSDSSAKGITILDGKNVNISHTEINNINTLNHEGWLLTGALTIYEAEVNISHLTIKNNFCEDALNLIRCHFAIESLTISDTKGDGFDADFCTGNLTKSLFKNTGNDCIDFSGSVVDISHITIRNSGDKGVSSGELSELKLSDIDIDGALTALASKDGSTLIGNNIHAINCEVGAALYKKKPEYENSKMILTNCSFDKIAKRGLIEKGARLTYAGYHFFGSEIFDIEAMYSRFEK